MNRRGFLGAILAAAAAPAIVRADSLMRIVPRETEVLTWSGVDLAGGGASEVVIQWIDDVESAMKAQVLHGGGAFLVPPGISGVWVSCFGSGGGGSNGRPFGQAIMEPVMVKPGRVLRV